VVDWIHSAENSGWYGSYVCNECRKFLNWWSFVRQPAAWVSLTGLKVLILAVCRYANACGYCMGRWVSTSGWKMYIGKQLCGISLQFMVFV